MDREQLSSLKARIDACVDSNQSGEARGLLATLWREEASPATAGFVLERVRRLPRTHQAKQRVAFLRSFTIEPLLPTLEAAAALSGIDVETWVGGYSTYAQELLEPGGKLDEFRPDTVVVAVQGRDAVPEIWDRFGEIDAREVDRLVEHWSADLAHWIRAFRSRSNAHVIVHDFELPPSPAWGLLDGGREPGQAETIRRMNRDLRRLAHEGVGIHVLDYDGLVARHGREAWHDEAKWLTMRMPIASAHHRHLVDEWLRFLCPIAGRICKVVVTDLDDTLWGGVLGEEGSAGIKLGVEYPGAAYRAVQRALLDLRRRGILLAICSKNEPAEVRETLASHPEMLLRPEHFSASQIGWDDKATGLRKIAEELNLGIDSLAFVDDNPAERAWVRSELPEVTVLELPRDPIRYAAAIRSHPAFERLTLSEEDQNRSDLYAADRSRAAAAREAASPRDFLESLRMEAEVALVDAATRGRVAQLTQKTNQFNLTTRRYSEQEVASLEADPAVRVIWMRLWDRFGDHGVVGVAITRRDGLDCEIDTLLLSCRVIGRTADSALLSVAADLARRDGAARITGWFVPTKRNTPAADFYASHGFERLEVRGDATRWACDLSNPALGMPQWFRNARLP